MNLILFLEKNSAVMWLDSFMILFFGTNGVKLSGIMLIFSKPWLDTAGKCQSSVESLRVFAQISRHISAWNKQENYLYYTIFPASKQITMWLLKQLCLNVMMMNGWRCWNVIDVAMGGAYRVGNITTFCARTSDKHLETIETLLSVFPINNKKKKKKVA